MASRGDRVRSVVGLLAAGALLVLAGCGALGSLLGRGDPARAPGGSDAFRGAFTWPAEGTLSSSFGPRGRTNHDGIDIAAPEGTPVRAAADGTVLFSGALRGYGKTVIVEHRASLTTVYAHNRENLVAAGAKVRRGDVIATVGQTGKTTGPNLHFEVRRDKVARDPLAFLPARGSSVVAQRKPPPKPPAGVGG